MACPHSLVGTSDWCSQCRGARPRVVSRDDDTGAITLDGVPVARPFQPATDSQYAKRKRARRSTSADDDEGD